jgi:hypothetical protein
MGLWLTSADSESDEESEDPEHDDVAAATMMLDESPTARSAKRLEEIQEDCRKLLDRISDEVAAVKEHL